MTLSLPVHRLRCGRLGVLKSESKAGAKGTWPGRGADDSGSSQTGVVVVPLTRGV